MNRLIHFPTMKEITRYIVIALCIIISCTTLTVYSQTSKTVTGKVIDSRNRKGLSNVSVSIVGSNIGTVTNDEGKFSLYIPSGAKSGVNFSTIGYTSVTLPADSLKSVDNIIRLNRQPVELSEVVIYGGDPMKIISSALSKIPENYSAKRDMLSMFYRETIRKGKRFIGVSEAAIEVYKTPYDRRNVDFDRVQIDRGRRLVSQKSSDTLAVKIVGGPTLAVNLDIVKNANILFEEKELNDFDFIMDNPEYYDGRLQYVISFKPKINREYAQFRGKIYIDMEHLSFTRTEFEMMPDKDKMTAAILSKKPRGMRFSPQKINFVVSYKLVDGKTYLNYISNVMQFKCDMKRRLFSSAYTTHTEMVVVDRVENTPERISHKNSFKPRQIFYDLVDEYWDEGYWADYNIIEPTESLEKAVDKLKKAQR